jgi:hypothetical protein
VIQDIKEDLQVVVCQSIKKNELFKKLVLFLIQNLLVIWLELEELELEVGISNLEL